MTDCQHDKTTINFCDTCMHVKTMESIEKDINMHKKSFGIWAGCLIFQLILTINYFVHFLSYNFFGGITFTILAISILLSLLNVLYNIRWFYKWKFLLKKSKAFE